MSTKMMFVFLLCCCTSPGAAEPGTVPTRMAGSVSLPGVRYEVLRSGPTAGQHPTRANAVEVRYVGRLTNGQVFSTSPDEGAGTSTFNVRMVIPGFSALIQLMRPGDRWRMTIPAYLAYGSEGKRLLPGDPRLKRDVPPDSTLVFEVELVRVLPEQ